MIIIVESKWEHGYLRLDRTAKYYCLPFHSIPVQYSFNHLHNTIDTEGSFHVYVVHKVCPFHHANLLFGKVDAQYLGVLFRPGPNAVLPLQCTALCVCTGIVQHWNSWEFRKFWSFDSGLVIFLDPNFWLSYQGIWFTCWRGNRQQNGWVKRFGCGGGIGKLRGSCGELCNYYKEWHVQINNIAS